MNQHHRISEPLQQLKLLVAHTATQAALQSDAELLELYVACADRRAMETLVQRYSVMVASVCRLTVDDPASAEDAFQATFLILLKSAKKIRKRGSVAAWLHGVAYRTASRIRIQNRRQRSAAMSMSTSIDEQTQSCDQELIYQLARKMELEVLDRELENLPGPLREPLIEHYMLGYTAAQIAARMELSVAAVEGRLRRGRRVLRHQLARRGVSLSVALAGAHWFQQHVQAAEAVAWSDSFLSSVVPPLVPTETTAGHGSTPQISSMSPQISSLVAEELSMWFTFGSLKIVAPATLLLLASAWAALQQNGEAPSGAGGGSTPVPTTTIDGSAAKHQPFVVAQMGGLGGMGQAIADTTTIKGGTPPDPILWEKPADGKTPDWLAGGEASTQAIDANRSALAGQTTVDFSGIPLDQVIQALMEDTGVPLALNLAEIELMGVSPTQPVTLQATASLREILRRISAPLELSYVITESAIEITSLDDAESRHSIRFYDLAYVLPNSANAGAVVSAIEMTIAPDSWLSSGGNGSTSIVGSMLIVSAADIIHQEIEILLLNLSKMNPRNAERLVREPTLMMPMGGMGAQGVQGVQGVQNVLGGGFF